MPNMQATEIPVDEDLVAAALAAVGRYMEEVRRDDMPEPSRRPVWSAAAVLAAHGQTPDRAGTHMGWGTIDRVGADFVETAVHAAAEPRRRQDVRDVELLPLRAIALVRRSGV